MMNTISVLVRRRVWRRRQRAPRAPRPGQHPRRCPSKPSAQPHAFSLLYLGPLFGHSSDNALLLRRLNGQLLQLGPESAVPKLEPRTAHGRSMTVAPFTAAFFVFRANAESCGGK